MKKVMYLKMVESNNNNEEEDDNHGDKDDNSNLRSLGTY